MTAAIRRDESRSASPGNRVEPRTGDDGVLILALSGHWRISRGLASISDIAALLDCEPGIHTIRAEDHGLEGWDSSLVSYLLKVSDLCVARKIDFECPAC
jgi:phospholipid/cholesterol/gamma-HCH transport system permease protein